MDNKYLVNINQVLKIQKCNEYTNKYGLTLTENEIINIIQKRDEVLKETQRIEFGESIIDQIIKAFCDSPFINKQNYAETVYELIEIFYFYKNETNDALTDDELIKYMKENFNGICQGSLEYLSGTVLDKLVHKEYDEEKDGE